MSSEPPMTSDIKPDDTAAAIALLQTRLEEMRKFTARRFDEISMEINAASQQFEMAEHGLSDKFSNVMTALSAISFQGNGDTPHNVGVELSSVMKTTEDAANTIIDSVMQIETLLDTAGMVDPHELALAIRNHTQTILMSCSFQDLTGQRITQTLERIRAAETELNDTLKGIGINIDVTPESMMQTVLPNTVVSNQADIDALFG